MLVVYNETVSSWTKTNITDKLSKLAVTNITKDGKTRYIDIMCSNMINIDTIQDIKETDKCVTMYSGNTNIKFQKKDLRPYIVSADKNNTDILLITIALKGKLLKSITNTKAAILNYLFAKGEMTMTVSIRDFGEGYKFQFVLHDPKLVADTIYTFTRVGDEYKVNIDMVQVDDVITTPTFKINQFRPIRPTNLIFAKDVDFKALTTALPTHDKHVVSCFKNTTDLNENMLNYAKQKYKAATLFVAGEEVTDEHSALVTQLRTNFKIINILLGNGKTIIYR